MIPSVVASEVTGALRDFLATGFGASSPELANVVVDFLSDPANLVKGPYLSVALPFRRAPEGGEPFPEVPFAFTPYRHQRTAFSRLAASAGQSTVIATGTGSGKTECFLYPVLDYCREQATAPGAGNEGIKAILIYPMNALAMDQARRIAQTIYRTPSLRVRVSAGLYVGESERTPHTTMGSDHVITDRGTLRERAPDILLTNYKMLDFLLVRPIDHRLWRHNAPDTLRYLVVDELHTFDGAQGTDLACLVRRLRSRLGVARERLICAGTSATIGGEESREELLDYVSRIFDQPFEPDAIVGEVRQGIDEFLGRSIEAGRVPFTVTCDCISATWSSHDLWVPESPRIELHAPEESGESEDNSAPPTEQGSLALHEGTIDAKFAESWMEAMELVDPHLRGLMRSLFLRRMPTPVVGYELVRGTGAVLAESELAWAANLLAGSAIDDLDGGSDDNNGIRSLTRGPAPVLERFDTQKEQIAFLARYLATLQTSGEALRAVCVVSRTTGERDAIKKHLLARDIEVEVIDRDAIDDAAHVGVRLATMHRVKGLEFERVVMASMNEGLVPLSVAIAGKGDDTARESAETEER